MRKTTIVTGATGFVGANLARRLLELGHDVHLIVKPNFLNWRLDTMSSHVRIYDCGLDNLDRLTTLFADVRPDWVFHLAAHGAYPDQSDLREMVMTNVLGTANLVEASVRQGVEALVNAGTSSEYGFKSEPPTEREVLEPNSHYAVTKAAATHLCMHAARVHDVRMPTVRLYSIYGPFEEPTRLIPKLIMHGLDGKLPPLVSPDVSRDFVHVDDASDAFIAAASAPNAAKDGVYNIGTGVQTSMREVVEAARNVMPIAVEPVWGSMQGRKWDTTIWVANNDRAVKELDWRPQYSFVDGLRKCVPWFAAHRHEQPYADQSAK